MARVTGAWADASRHRTSVIVPANLQSQLTVGLLGHLFIITSPGQRARGEVVNAQIFNVPNP